MNHDDPRNHPPVLTLHTNIDDVPATALGAIVYGIDARDRCSQRRDPRLAGVSLDVAPGSACVEAWHMHGEVRSGTQNGIAFRASHDHLFAVLEIDERLHGGAYGAALEAYSRIVAFHKGGDYPYPWRIWNFIDAINEGEGDEERYRQFCLGRAQGLGQALGTHPAASAVGRRDGDRTLQVIWLAGRAPGRHIENPRQVSAFNYPRQYGPAAPSFSRAMRLGNQLFISGTSSIVGHKTLHAGDVAAQLNETIDNLETVTRAAGIGHGRPEALKAYVRHARDRAAVVQGIRARCQPAPASCIVLADICRSDLLVELEGISIA